MNDRALFFSSTSGTLAGAQAALRTLDGIVLGKHHALRLAMACILARGHLLLEDLPGMGKTVLAHALAKTLGLSYHRVQFTSDMLPADLTGGSIFDRAQGTFLYHPGPIFTQILLADEINRASPKTQSALLEAMEERQVSCDGTTRALPEPFFVIATQNPVDTVSTNALPEAQLDRFLMRISLGYPDAASELALLRGEDTRERIATLLPALSPAELLALQQRARSITASEALLQYLRELAQHTRHHAKLAYGLSPRATLALLAAARAWAMLEGRDHVLPSDVQAVFGPVVLHRLGLEDRADLAQELLHAVAIP